MKEDGLDRRGSSILWKYGTVNIDTLLFRDLEKFEWKDFAISYDDKVIALI